MNSYEQEVNSLQIWLKQTAGLNSMRLTAAPPILARPVVLFEQPARGKDRNISRWLYVNNVEQYGKLYVHDFDQAAALQYMLLSDLEERVGVLPIYGPNPEDPNGPAVEIAVMKAAQLRFNTSENLDVPFTLEYETTYSRQQPDAAPAATYVGTRITVQNYTE